VLEQRLEDIGTDIDTVDAQLNLPGGDPVTIETLTTERDRLLEEQATLRSSLDRIELSSGLATADQPEIINAAVSPGSPFEPTLRRNLILGLVIGLMAGIGAAFLRDYLDESIKSEDDLESTSGLPTLASVPAVNGWRDREGALLVSLTDPMSPAAEGYRALRTSLQYLSLTEPIKTLLVTSTQPNEGKSTTVANLAVAFARADLKVVVLSCDLRRPRVHEFFGVPNDVGVTSVLMGDAEVSEAAVKVPDLPNLVLFPSGPIPPNPSELLASQRARDLITEAGRVADIVLIDAPPVQPVTDALVLSRFVDASVVVTRSGHTGRRTLRRTLESLAQVGVPTNSRYSYHYYYYGSKPGSSKSAEAVT
jgi:capsular exopolysaccharide synthesis family protein